MPHREFKNAKPPTFDRMDVTGLVEKVWLLGMERYFKMHDYSKNEKAQISIFNLSGRALIWWEYLVQVKGVNERRLDWGQFQTCFREKYLTTWYYDNKRREFHELKLGQKSMECRQVPRAITLNGLHFRRKG